MKESSIYMGEKNEFDEGGGKTLKKSRKKLRKGIDKGMAR